MSDGPIHRFAAAPMDRPTMFISAAFVAALAGVALSVPGATREMGPILFGLAGPAALVVLAYGFSPDAYDLPGDGRLRVVRRLFGSKTFRIDTAAPMPALFGLGGIRLLGSGGAFGWYGLFWRKGTGRYRAYVTDRAALVACQGPDGLVVISPQNPADFIAAVADVGGSSHA